MALVGFTGYLIIGVLAVGLSALFYHYIELVQGSKYTGLNQGLAWAHFVLLNVGAIGASWLMMLAGFMATGALGVFLGGIGYVRAWMGGRSHLPAAA